MKNPYSYTENEMGEAPKEPKCTCKEHDPYCCQVHGICPTCVKKEEPKQDCTCERPNDNTCDYCDAQESKRILEDAKLSVNKQETLEEVAEKLKGKELFKESNDRARKILSEIKSLPKQERSYSEEELRDMLQSYVEWAINGYGTYYDWFEQFKKK